MSGDILSQKLQQDILNELVTTNQLLQSISHELHQIKQMTSASGEFEENITKNASLVKILADLQQINIDKLPPMARTQIHTNQLSYLNNSTMDDSR